MTDHDIVENKYDIEILEEELLDSKHVIKVKTVVDGEEYVKQFNFTHDQTPGGSLNSWKKFVRRWIDKICEENEACEVCDREGKTRFNVDKESSVDVS